jgi:hypothetical protein
MVFSKKERTFTRMVHMSVRYDPATKDYYQVQPNKDWGNLIPKKEFDGVARNFYREVRPRRRRTNTPASDKRPITRD